MSSPEISLRPKSFLIGGAGAGRGNPIASSSTSRPGGSSSLSGKDDSSFSLRPQSSLSGGGIGIGNNSSSSSSSHSHRYHDSTGPEIPAGEKQPLEGGWTLWYDRRPSQAKRLRGEKDTYESNLQAVGTFSTIEDFWCHFNHLAPPSHLENNSNYHFFRDGVKPMWEDPANSEGGKWVLSLKGDRSMLDQYWETVLLLLIGEVFESSEDICGAVISRRKHGDKIAIWNKYRTDQAGIQALGKLLRTTLGLDSKVQLQYLNHEDSLRTGSSYSNPERYNAW